MKPSRLKKVIAQVPKDEPGIIDLLNRIAIAQLDRERLVAERDKLLRAAAEAVEAEHKFDERIQAETLNLAKWLELVEAWAAINQAAFGDLKSMRKAGFTIGWRLGNWKTATGQGWTWEKVRDYLAALVRAGEESAKSDQPDADAVKLGAQAAAFLRVKVEPDREAMLRSREDKEVSDLFAAAGVEFEQDETFFIDPDRDGQQPATLTAP